MKTKSNYNTKRKAIFIAFSLLSLAILTGAVFTALLYNGIILVNNPSREKYPVRGVDVSSYQGEIDWEVLSSQNISFAFIKATEGSSLVDPKFEYNFSEAQKQDISIGAYHFFSYDSPAQTQAQNFIDAVEPFEGMLPPVIDLEFYGDKETDPPSREYVEGQLEIMLGLLEAHYRLKPIIYATEKSYELYLSGDYKEYDIWIRDVYSKPALSDGRTWTFWQFTNRARLEGYSGREQYIDVNVFSGSKEEFAEYPRYIFINSEKQNDN